MNISPVFDKSKLQQVADINLNNNQIISGQRLWDHLCETDKAKPEVYRIILQGIKLLAEPSLTIEDYQNGFKLIKQLPEAELKKAGAFHDVALNVLANKKHADIKPFIDLAATFGTNPVITRATQIAEGGFGIVYKVERVAGKALEQLPELAMKVTKDKGKTLIRSEIDFLNNLHKSSKLTEEEKAYLPPKLIEVTYKTSKMLIMSEIQTGYMTKLFKGGSLSRFMEHLSPDQRIDIAKQIVYKISLLSKAGAIYTDIKLENILVDTSTKPITVHFCDFSGCYFSDNPKGMPSIGALPITQSYTNDADFGRLSNAAAEAKQYYDLDRNLYVNSLKEKVNWHMSRATGLLLCELLTGKWFPLKEPDLKGDIGYTDRKLIQYYYNIKDELNPQFQPIIKEMLGIPEDSQTKLLPPITPEEALNALKT